MATTVIIKDDLDGTIGAKARLIKTPAGSVKIDLTDANYQKINAALGVLAEVAAKGKPVAKRPARDEMTRRNAAIIRERRDGTEVAKIAAAYRLTTARIYQISGTPQSERALELLAVK